MEEKIMAMLRSGEPETFRLGVILALGYGENFREAFHIFTVNAAENKKGRHDFGIIPVPYDLQKEGLIYVKGGIAISLRERWMKCDYWYRMHPSMNHYKVIILDEDNEENT